MVLEDISVELELKRRKTMTDFLFLCNKESICSKHKFCGNPCNHTTNPDHAKNPDSVRIAEEFKKTFMASGSFFVEKDS